MLCVISAQCSIEAQAYGANSKMQAKHGYVKLNGVAVWQASWQGEYPNHRGANVIIVDPATCTVKESLNYDTHGDRNATAQLRDYLQGLRDGTVLVGVSCDEASLCLTDALPTLSALGADVSDVGHRGAWVFVAEKGDPSKTEFDKELTEAAAYARQPRISATFTGAICCRIDLAEFIDEFIVPIA